ncbi:hypothetical protein SAMN02910451_01882 [Butyrivibrio hungatei]|uniref:Uncharacterized protein n=1 Tax=Butyrivibrio hungatei TaxID=185008 RepID=A0A1G5EAI2_9FIRM|nr:hypothetical protein [Butyrivibrio hungatei]SCY23976.1 hypothetical protein SAMN02910451_01882 [Butyrivibrio hungatei]
MKQLTKKAEVLLEEILEHRLENGDCDTNYWKDRFEEYSVSEDAIIRSLFKELREAGMILVSWYDDYPAVLMLLSNGVSYFEEKDSNDNLAAHSSSYVNNFYGAATNVQIQQGTVDSFQKMNGEDFNSLVRQLVQTVNKYDAVLESEYGDAADDLRKNCKDLAQTDLRNANVSCVKKTVSYIRDLSVNAGGGLIAAGIIEIATRLLR